MVPPTVGLEHGRQRVEGVTVLNTESGSCSRCAPVQVQYATATIFVLWLVVEPFQKIAVGPLRTALLRGN